MLLIRYFSFLILLQFSIATNNIYLNGSNYDHQLASELRFDLQESLQNFTIQDKSVSDGLIQDKSVVGDIFEGLGGLVCAFFLICDIVQTAVDVGLEIGEAVSSKNSDVEEAIKAATRHVAMRG